MYVSLRFRIEEKAGIDAPQFTTTSQPTRKYDRAGYHATMGLGPDLMEASKDSVRRMVDYISRKWRMERWEAYILSSIVVDLKISEIVDKPNYIVTAHLPLGIFNQN
jgi:acetamidase/formamidase